MIVQLREVLSTSRMLAGRKSFKDLRPHKTLSGNEHPSHAIALISDHVRIIMR